MIQLKRMDEKKLNKTSTTSSLVTLTNFQKTRQFPSKASLLKSTTKWTRQMFIQTHPTSKYQILALQIFKIKTRNFKTHVKMIILLHNLNHSSLKLSMSLAHRSFFLKLNLRKQMPLQTCSNSIRRSLIKRVIPRMTQHSLLMAKWST